MLYNFQDAASLVYLSGLRDLFLSSDVSRLSRQGGQAGSRSPLDQLMAHLWQQQPLDGGRVVIETNWRELEYLLPATRKKYFKIPESGRDWRPSSEGQLDGIIVVKFRDTILGEFRATIWTLANDKPRELWIVPIFWEAKQKEVNSEQARVQLETSMSTMAAVLFHLGIQQPVFGCVQTEDEVTVLLHGFSGF
ncbi:hypothetical protein VKT23_008585 [Stygiomarasmius scandens]|uniref:Uncharacterized protein n=1 Tax=Marasmiellus scandens TaxID=2682957 RepID=A0ABR1JHP2_9AGAR